MPGSNCTTECRHKRGCSHKGCHGGGDGGNGGQTDPPPRCGDGKVDASAGEECDEGDSNNGKDWSACTASCKNKGGEDDNGDDTTSSGGGGGHGGDGSHCETCNPNPFFNKCTITTSCIVAPHKQNYCACRAGYRANGLLPTDQRQFRLKFPGQEYRVFVAPGIECDTLCTNPHPGPESCQEVPVREDC
ncbi:hypothetical protein VTI28DRAFT_8611 [Corynascus sepedonium]